MLKENPEYEMASNAFQTLTVYYGHASCEHALAKHGCNSTDALNLSMKPDSLIHYLYQHPSIVTRFYDPGDYYPGTPLFFLCYKRRLFFKFLEFVYCFPCLFVAYGGVIRSVTSLLHATVRNPFRH